MIKGYFQFLSHASTLKGGDQQKVDKRVKGSNRMETKNNWRVLRLNSRYMFGKKRNYMYELIIRFFKNVLKQFLYSPSLFMSICLSVNH